MSQLASLIDDDHLALPEIADYLDGLDADVRWSEVSQLGRTRQRALYEKAASAAPIDFEHLVGDAPPRMEVIHDGLNTLPLPPPLQHFQKRFCRPAFGADRLFGYNEGPTRRLVGPGYFVAIPTADRPTWAARGAVVVDYYQVPDAPVAPGWPRVVPNDWRFQRFVYHQTRDYLRRVSRHVSIGAAYKGEKPLDHYFVLCRQVS